MPVGGAGYPTNIQCELSNGKDVHLCPMGIRGERAS